MTTYQQLQNLGLEILEFPDMRLMEKIKPSKHCVSMRKEIEAVIAFARSYDLNVINSKVLNSKYRYIIERNKKTLKYDYFINPEIIKISARSHLQKAAANYYLFLDQKVFNVIIPEMMTFEYDCDSTYTRKKRSTLTLAETFELYLNILWLDGFTPFDLHLKQNQGIPNIDTRKLKEDWEMYIAFGIKKRSQLSLSKYRKAVRDHYTQVKTEDSFYDPEDLSGHPLRGPLRRIPSDYDDSNIIIFTFDNEEDEEDIDDDDEDN